MCVHLILSYHICMSEMFLSHDRKGNMTSWILLFRKQQDTFVVSCVLESTFQCDNRMSSAEGCLWWSHAFFPARSVITGLDLVQQFLSSAKCSENINPPTSHTVISPNTISWEGQDLSVWLISLISSSHHHYKSTGQNHRDPFIYHWF